MLLLLLMRQGNACLYAAVDQAGGEDGANKRPRIKDAPAAVPAAQGDIPPHQLASDPQQAPAQAPPPSAALPPRELVYGAEARRTTEGNSNKDMFISLVLQDFDPMSSLECACVDGH
jgi:hypothetical protein